MNSEEIRENSKRICEQIRNNQNVKEMTRRAIKNLIVSGANVDDLKSEFFAIYGEQV